MKSKTILSLFDGFSGGQQSSIMAGIEVGTYASEIDKHAIKAKMAHILSYL